ncbi:MAG: sigma-70 family RNA polymerase sigma factor [Nitrospira sp.]|nr:MAG: sigma-70 family RNA polymerase sigma factor [Nitrospira sp.]
MNTASQFAASTIDPKLVARVAKGEHPALGQLYDQSSTVLFSLALHILGNREDAADVLQEIYLDVWRKVVRYDVGRGTPITWLITLTRNRAIDRLQTRGPRTPRHISPSIDDARTSPFDDRQSDLFDSQTDQALRHLIREAWATLPQKQQQAIELAYYEGLPDTEIAVRLNQPVEEVKTSIVLGMTHLREALHSYWAQDEAV